jgi:hypothetical protein
MVYINSHGNLVDQKRFTLFGFLQSILAGIKDFFSLFLASITGNPAQIQVRQRRDSNRPLPRNRVKGSNIRSVKSLGTAEVRFWFEK